MSLPGIGSEPNCRSAGGFTLIELLVVIAIIGVLVAILLPAVQQAREASRAGLCRNNLKQTGLALHNYHEVHGCFPAYNFMFTNYPTYEKHCGWVTNILPQLDQTALYHAYNFDKSYSEPENAEVVTRPLAVMQVLPPPGASG